jgi:ribonuclease VapC
VEVTGDLVIDSSVAVAILFDEPDSGWCVEQLNQAQGRLLMSTVNLAECLIHLADRAPEAASQGEDIMGAFGFEYVPPDALQAMIAARARLQYPLNLGDCFAYALAKKSNHRILTLDYDFRGIDLDVVLPPKRQRKR